LCIVTHQIRDLGCVFMQNGKIVVYGSQPLKNYEHS
jgi:glutamate synthase domain-containing protein 3